MKWIDITEEPMPLETGIIVSHRYGVEAIHFFNANWRYWYTGTPVSMDTIKSITHWFKPESI